MLSFIIHSPLDQFEVTSLIALTAPVLGDFVISLTNLGLYTIITLVFVIGLHLMRNNSYRLIPSRYSVALESAYASVHGMVRDQIGSANEEYLPFIYAIF
jgi:F-type H+-transporting ATPase subunit a